MSAEDNTDDSILKADPRLRRRLVTLLVLMGAVGAAVILGLERHLQSIVEASQDQPERATRQVFNLLRLTMAIGGGGLIFLALYLGRFSLRVISEARFPPAGTKVIRDTPILRGASARTRGRIGFAFALLILLGGFFIPWIPDLLIRPMMQRMEQQAPPGDANPPSQAPAGAQTELHALGRGRPQPGLAEIGPGPSPSNRSLTS